ncbi:hypothetical protein DPMN_021736 [Dreissena polymorpha]|uniref:Uncharacterized protein n=1 Tax=Dreissena polymorpha TaxID=45954 RepID=A0A9D4NMN7_DREPO|nr:hypothetical protein DPMN_021736 [Dreissena polymorpha]
MTPVLFSASELQHLLSIEDKGVVKGSAKSKSSDVRGENCRSAPAQSTSIDIKLTQQPHKSRLQETQSRTTLPRP